MGRILIAHASRFGRTRAIADALATQLRKHGYEADVACTKDGMLPPPQDYDAVVLGSRFELGHHARAIGDYIREYKTALAEIPTAFFSVSFAAAIPFAGLDPGNHLERTFRELEWLPDHAVAFGRIGTPQTAKLADLVAINLSERLASEFSPSLGPV